MIHFGTNYYYSLNTAGTLIWSLIKEGPIAGSGLVDELASRYGWETAEIERDLGGFLESLEAEELVLSGTEGQAASGASASSGQNEVPSYEAPVLTKHNTLERLIVSGE